MCTTPITIPNPYYNIGDKGLNFIYDTVNAFIQVPCGQCLQCISLRQSYVNQRVQMESLRSELFMLTLTYNSDLLPIINVGEYCLAFPEWKDVQNMFKRIRKILPHAIRYIMCSEYGMRKRRPHFHGIIAVEKQSIIEHYKGSVSLCERELARLFLKEWRVKVGGSLRAPIYQNLCTFVRKGKKCNFDFHHIVHICNHENDVTFYVSKYITKHDETIHKLLTKIKLDPEVTPEQTPILLSAIKPRCTISKDFGSPDYPPIREYIRSCIMRDETSLPQYYDIYTGKSSLLSRYYRKHCETMSNALTRFYYNPEGDPLSNHRELSGTQLDWKQDADKALKSKKQLNKIKNHLKRCEIE